MADGPIITEVVSEAASVDSASESAGEAPTKVTAAAPTTLKTVLFLGSVRDGRFGWRVSQFVKKVLEEEYGHEVDLIDPLEIQFPMLKMPLHFYPDPSQVPPYLVEVNERIKAADAFVLVSPEYNYSIPPALSNMIDHFPSSSFAFKPTGIAVYSMGPVGGQRVVPQLLNLLSALNTIAVPTSFSIPIVQEALDADGNPVRKRLVEKAKSMASQLDWLARATKAQRESAGIPALTYE